MHGALHVCQLLHSSQIGSCLQPSWAPHSRHTVFLSNSYACTSLFPECYEQKKLLERVCAMDQLDDGRWKAGLDVRFACATNAANWQCAIRLCASEFQRCLFGRLNAAVLHHPSRTDTTGRKPLAWTPGHHAHLDLCPPLRRMSLTAADLQCRSHSPQLDSACNQKSRCGIVGILKQLCNNRSRNLTLLAATLHPPPCMAHARQRGCV